MGDKVCSLDRIIPVLVRLPHSKLLPVVGENLVVFDNQVLTVGNNQACKLVVSDNAISNCHAVRIDLRPDAIAEVVRYQAILDNDVSVVGVKPQALGQIPHGLVAPDNN